ncbi:MAG: YkvA family protein [Desulfobacteraceae bacterium]
MNDAGEEAPDARKTRKSRPYKKAKNRAAEYIRSPVELRKLVDDAQEKAGEKKGPLDEVRESLSTCLRLIRAYADGSYRQVSLKPLLMIVASIVYFVMPIDLMPDFIIAFGLIDDAALLTWTAKAFKKELDEFAAWENRSTN